MFSTQSVIYATQAGIPAVSIRNPQKYLSPHTLELLQEIPAVSPLKFYDTLRPAGSLPKEDTQKLQPTTKPHSY